MTSIQVLACEWPVVSCRDPPARLKSTGEAKGTAPPNQTSEMSPLALGAEGGGLAPPSQTQPTYLTFFLKTGNSDKGLPCSLERDSLRSDGNYILCNQKELPTLEGLVLRGSL